MGDTLSYEQKTELQFDSFIKKSLSNEVKRYFNERKKRLENEIMFCETDDYLASSMADVAATDEIDSLGLEFQVLKYPVTVCNELLYVALAQIDEQSRNVVLLHDLLDMTDLEIADELKLSRSWIKDIRLNAYANLKKILEDQGYDVKSFFL